jgi:hypothetical protein
VLARSIVAFAYAGSLAGTPAFAEPPMPRDEFEPVEITAVERPVEAVPAPVLELEPSPTPIVHEPAPPPPPSRCMQDRRCRGMRIAGIAVGIVGLAAVGTGIGLIARDDRVLADSPAFVSSTRPPGLVTLTIGVGVSLTAVLVLVASRSASRAPATARTAR